MCESANPADSARRRAFVPHLATAGLTVSILVFASSFISGCAGESSFSVQVPAFNESGHETARSIVSQDYPDGKTFAVDQPTILRFRKANVLEFKVEIPAGSVIGVPDNYQVSVLDFRKSDGTIERSSTGFITPIKLIGVPIDYSKEFSAEVIAGINSVPGGLFVTAAIVGDMQGVEGDFEVLHAASPGAGFLEFYEESGRPKFNFIERVKERFGPRLNRGVAPESQASAERAKWRSIFKELRRAALRTEVTPKALIMIAKDLAEKESVKFETTGIVPLNGAWTIATQATAPRHNFGNVPCAETMSEFVREAYQRAGFVVTDDFNSQRGNQLIWSNTAAVVNFSKALYDAGWVPWDPREYRPIAGALLMNGSGRSPGHTYISAGDDGRFIVDNGAPQGRDLRATSSKIIGMMYQTGVFFLPPGINPPPWSSRRHPRR